MNYGGISYEDQYAEKNSRWNAGAPGRCGYGSCGVNLTELVGGQSLVASAEPSQNQTVTISDLLD